MTDDIAAVVVEPAKYRKKPVVVEAIQWFPGIEIEGVITDPKALIGIPGTSVAHQIELESAGTGVIVTLEGVMFVSPGDWIITGIAGEKYPCKPEIFDATYEPVI